MYVCMYVCMYIYFRYAPTITHYIGEDILKAYEITKETAAIQVSPSGSATSAGAVLVLSAAHGSPESFAMIWSYASQVKELF